MATACSLWFCSNTSQRKKAYLEETGKSLHFHMFPADALRREKWIRAISRVLGKELQVIYRFRDRLVSDNTTQKVI